MGTRALRTEPAALRLQHPFTNVAVSLFTDLRFSYSILNGERRPEYIGDSRGTQ